MFATIEVRKDDSLERLCFRSKEDTESFQEFVRIYMNETGAGNGYGAYWIFDLDIGLYERVPRRSVVELETERVRDMLRAILKARTATAEPDMAQVKLVTGSENGAIVFELGELPPRQRPAVGDMFLVVDSKATKEERLIGEGRVLRDLGDELEVVKCCDETDSGTLKPDAKRVRVRTSVVMKVRD